MRTRKKDLKIEQNKVKQRRIYTPFFAPFIGSFAAFKA
jgi:hypothetical protein